MKLGRTATEKTKNPAVTSLNVAVMRCEGEMGEFEMMHLGEELFRLAHRGCCKVVLDLSGVDHVDYRGLRPMAARARLLRSAGGDLKLVGLNQYLVNIFRAAGVEEEFEVYQTAHQAKAAFVEAPALALARS